jgi:hypothetical protein
LRSSWKWRGDRERREMMMMGEERENEKKMEELSFGNKCRLSGEGENKLKKKIILTIHLFG